MLPIILPGKIAVFIFDNSSAHASLAPDALTVTKMNVGPGGKSPVMRDTVIPTSNPFALGGKAQSMVFPAEMPQDHEYAQFAGQPKGMRVVLEEQGFITRKGERAVNFQTGMRFIGECKLCKKKKAWKPHLESLTPDEQQAVDNEEPDDTEDEDAHEADCCMKWLLSLQDDFQNE